MSFVLLRSHCGSKVRMTFLPGAQRMDICRSSPKPESHVECRDAAGLFDVPDGGIEIPQTPAQTESWTQGFDCLRYGHSACRGKIPQDAWVVVWAEQRGTLARFGNLHRESTKKMKIVYIYIYTYIHIPFHRDYTRSCITIFFQNISPSFSLAC